MRSTCRLSSSNDARTPTNVSRSNSRSLSCGVSAISWQNCRRRIGSVGIGAPSLASRWQDGFRSSISRKSCLDVISVRKQRDFTPAVYPSTRTTPFVCRPRTGNDVTSIRSHLYQSIRPTSDPTQVLDRGSRHRPHFELVSLRYRSGHKASARCIC